MSTATAVPPRQTPHGQQRPPDEKSLFEQILDLPVGEKVKQMDASLRARIDEIEALLPGFMKGQGERLIKRARLTFGGSLQLQQCTPASFVKCVLQAAEFGFAIDAKLCHAVPYNNTKKDANGKPYTVSEASCQIDYKGILATAKRIGVIQDGWARRVHEHDRFEMKEEDGVTHYHHSFDHKKPRGEVVGVLAVATHKDGWFRTEWMHIDDINKIRGRSKSYNGSGTSPWKTDPGEMEKKTCLKRLLKTFSDDPGLVRLLEIDTEDYETEETDSPPRKVTVASTLDDLTTMLSQSSYEPVTSDPPVDEAAADPPTTDDSIQPEAPKGEHTGGDWAAFTKEVAAAVEAMQVSKLHDVRANWTGKFDEERFNKALDDALEEITSRRKPGGKKPKQGQLMDTTNPVA